MHRTLIVVAAVGGLAMAALPMQIMAHAQGTKTMKADDKGGTKYPGSANGGIWKNKDDGKPAGRKLRPGGGYDIGPNKKL
jgi:hypothetical protein